MPSFLELLAVIFWPITLSVIGIIMILGLWLNF